MRASAASLASVALFSCLSWSSAMMAAAPSSVQRHVFPKNGRYLVIEALTDNLVHFELGAGNRDATSAIYTTPMVLKTDYPGPDRFVADASHVETATLRIDVDADLCARVTDLTLHAVQQTVCPEQMDQAWKGLSIVSPETRNVYGLGQYFSEEAADGDWIGRVWDPLADGFGARLRGFAGGANDYSMFPIMYALGAGKRAYGFFLDQVYKQMWDFRATPWRVGMWGDQIRWYFIQGADLPALRCVYMELTGRPPIPPKRSFGLWVSEFGFGSFDEVERTLRGLRAAHFPVEGFALDLQWFGGTFGDPDHSRMGSLTFAEQNFPNPADEVRRLGAQGVHLMLIEEPYISKTLPEYDALAAHGALARDCAGCEPTYLNYNPWWGRGGMLDFTSAAGADYWHDYRRQTLIDMGIHDHWADLGEPEQYNSSAWYFGFPELGKHAHADIHNIYGFRWMESIWRGYQRHQERARPFLLSRTGTSGIQRVGVGMWSGDIGTNWGNLKSQMNVQMHMALSGIDYYGSDVGGFQRARGAVEGGTERLYTQWLAASAALDVPVRPHAWNLDKQRSTSPAERGDLASNLANLRLRYRLMPYYYTLAARANAMGEPVFPPLVYYYQDDERARRNGHEKMIGPDLLVSIAADAYAAVDDVYLPRGTWIDFHTGEWIESSGQTVNGRPLYQGRLFRLPLFARAGAIVPMAVFDDQILNVQGRRVDGSTSTALSVRIYADATKTAFDLYDDDGETFDYQTGVAATTHMEQQRQGDTVSIGIGPVAGSYPGMSDQRELRLEVVAKDREAGGVDVDGQALPSCAHGGAAPCFRNDHETGMMLIELGGRALDMRTSVSVRLVPRTAPAPSLYFVCRGGETTSGVSVYAVGGVAALGGWDPARAIKLEAGAYPVWSALAHDLPPNATVEWKCLKRRDDGTGEVVWQNGDNARATTSAKSFGGATISGF